MSRQTWLPRVIAPVSLVRNQPMLSDSSLSARSTRPLLNAAFPAWMALSANHLAGNDS
jgi:hypothetical protein